VTARGPGRRPLNLATLAAELHRLLAGVPPAWVRPRTLQSLQRARELLQRDLRAAQSSSSSLEALAGTLEVSPTTVDGLVRAGLLERRCSCRRRRGEGHALACAAVLGGAG
jgi:DNA polymerase III epsilon subunit-like protein